MLAQPTLSPTLMTLPEARDLVRDEMQAVDELIRVRLRSDVALINRLSEYIIYSGGKRLRPMLMLLCAKLFGYGGTHHITLAAVIEFIHTATLLHDDVVDASELRRGKQTANDLWGNASSVLVGDFLYSRSFQMMVEVHNMQVMEILSNATNVIAEGEVLQLLNCHDPETSEQRYLDVIRRKTAKLFEAAAELGAVLNDQPSARQAAMVAYGQHLGTAFQLIDDVIDYSAAAEVSGKNIGDDLAEGKPTLPLIYALRHGNAEQRTMLQEVIRNGGKERISEVIAAIRATSALEYTQQAARQEAEKAIAALAELPNSSYNAALYSLAYFSVNRTF
jgi:octaprenyl-diphosphate synthase